MSENNKKLSLFESNEPNGFGDVIIGTSGIYSIAVGGSGHGGGSEEATYTDQRRREGGRDCMIGSGNPNIPNSDLIWVYNA